MASYHGQKAVVRHPKAPFESVSIDDPVALMLSHDLAIWPAEPPFARVAHNTGAEMDVVRGKSSRMTDVLPAGHRLLITARHPQDLQNSNMRENVVP